MKNEKKNRNTEPKKPSAGVTVALDEKKNRPAYERVTPSRRRDGGRQTGYDFCFVYYFFFSFNGERKKRRV